MENSGNGGFRAGDVVVLKSGGPPMTVNWVEEQYSVWQVNCYWFFADDKKKELRNASFPPAALEKVVDR